MGSITQVYENRIEKCTSYKELSSIVEAALINNVFGHIQPNMIPKIDELIIDQNIELFIMDLCVGVVYSTHSEMSFTLLRLVCNKLTSELDSINFKPSLKTILICYLASDDKSWYDTHCKEYDMLKAISYYILRNEVGEEENIPEIEGTLENIKANASPEDYIAQILSRVEAEENERRNKLFAQTLNSDEKDDAEIFIGDMLCEFLGTARMMEEQNQTYDTVGIPQGRFLINIIRILNNHRGFITTQATDHSKVVEVMKYCINELERNHISLDVIRFFRILMDSYSEDGEDAMMQGRFFDDIKAYLNSDPAFKYMADNFTAPIHELPPVLINDKQKDIFRELILQYVDPSVHDANLIMASTAATEAAEKAKQNEDWSQMEDEEEEESEENNKEEDVSKEERDYDIDARQSNKGYHKSSKNVADASRKIYKGWKSFEDNKQRVEGQINKMVNAGKRLYTGNQVEAIINGNKWTPMQILRTALTSSAVFAFNPILGICTLCLNVLLKPRVSRKKRLEFVRMLDDEIRMLDEKIDDARGDGNRKAKYALMRTKNELVNTRDKIRYNLTTTKSDVKNALNFIKGDANSRGD